MDAEDERVGYVMHIAFESDNHRLVRQSETFHLKGGYTHDKGFARTYQIGRASCRERVFITV